MSLVIRRNFSPKVFREFLALSFVTCMIFLTAVFEIFVVMPTFFPTWTVTYTSILTFGLFLLYNVTTNLLLFLITDTSVKANSLDSQKPSNKEHTFCAKCNTWIPERSFHCKICDTCILKRDHHCYFAGCCVGYCNYRYYLIFLLYFFISSLYVTIFNILFVTREINCSVLEFIAKLCFPLMIFLIDYSSDQIYLFFTIMSIIGCIYTLFLFIYHVNLILNGQVTYEYKHNMNKCYKTGWKKNLEEALGERWHVIWISPFIESKLLL